MTQSVKGKTQAEVEELFGEFHKIVTGEAPASNGKVPAVGKLSVFAGVSAYPVRVKCATLAWHTLRAALAGEHESVATELAPRSGQRKLQMLMSSGKLVT